ncbi:MAG: class II aldolase/adducin family protein [Anaerolineae bacterium]|nr:class II aldolase/adducin family protein [Anaerolineae bacterium]
MNEAALRAELTRIAIKTYTRGLVHGTGGNVSVRLGADDMLITPSGVALGDTTEANIVRVNLSRLDWVPNEPYIPSKEYRFHAEIFHARADVTAIVHCHPPYATAYAVRKMDIPYVTDAAFKQPAMPHVAFAASGTTELADRVGASARANADFRVMLLDEHGIVAVGANLVQAYNFADLTEELAQIAYLAATIPG